MLFQFGGEHVEEALVSGAVGFCLFYLLDLIFNVFLLFRVREIRSNKKLSRLQYTAVS